MPNPYIFAADFVKEYSDDDKKGLDSVNQYIEKIEQMLNHDANNKFIDDFKQFKKHFTTLTDPSLYIGNDENNKKKYVQSAVWLENFMKYSSGRR